jgi:hypothetical protein
MDRSESDSVIFRMLSLFRTNTGPTKPDFATLNQCRLLFEHSYFPRFPARNPHVWFHLRELGPRGEPLRGEQAKRKVERQVRVLIKNVAIFFLCPSKQFLSISFQIQLLENFAQKQKEPRHKQLGTLISWLPLKLRNLKIIGPHGNFKSNNSKVDSLQIPQRLNPK